jgi:hypothetical protein
VACAAKRRHQTDERDTALERKFGDLARCPPALLLGSIELDRGSTKLNATSTTFNYPDTVKCDDLSVANPSTVSYCMPWTAKQRHITDWGTSYLLALPSFTAAVTSTVRELQCRPTLIYHCMTLCTYTRQQSEDLTRFHLVPAPF